MAPSTPKLFMPVTLGGKSPIQLKHRGAMAPFTRLRTGAEGDPKPSLQNTTPSVPPTAV
ncbi:hypothetical protein PI125_g21257 [Phytophthora idaei]|nr:hypothetical protein PI125_g21257 [Phytophthora idaei]KAG3132448.1 hypothetical protein PI126_g19637 [Phytophthora idaei]